MPSMFDKIEFFRVNQRRGGFHTSIARFCSALPLDNKGTVGPFAPHVRFYAPCLTNADLGSDGLAGGGPTFVAGEGTPGALIIVPVGGHTDQGDTTPEKRPPARSKPEVFRSVREKMSAAISLKRIKVSSIKSRRIDHERVCTSLSRWRTRKVA